MFISISCGFSCVDALRRKRSSLLLETAAAAAGIARHSAMTLIGAGGQSMAETESENQRQPNTSITTVTSAASPQ
jgi:hypothetical protein